MMLHPADRASLVALTSAAVVLVASAVIGGRNAEISTDPEPAVHEPVGTIGSPDATRAAPSVDEPRDERSPRATDRAPVAPTRRASSRPSTPGATRTGIFDDHMEYGMHAALSVNGTPVNLARDPIAGIKGYLTDINRRGGINGRKVRLFLEDDRASTIGAAQARDRLVKEIKPFLISGAIGVDQIAAVAAGARDAGIPYMAIGGPEQEWKELRVFQLRSSDDQSTTLLVDFLCAHGADYVGEAVRLGTSSINSVHVRPVERRFVAAIERRGCVETPVDLDARVTVEKLDQQPTYTAEILNLKGAYGGRGANLIVPFQDVVATSRMVAELRGHADYSPRWTFFAGTGHDTDNAVKLIGADWIGVRGLSNVCYYHPNGNPNAYDASLCNRMGAAHRIWAGLGQVTYDENAGGCVGGDCNYDYSEASWERSGQLGVAGYQFLHFWNGAMTSLGADPTREGFVAALNAYDRYSDLLTAPITFKGSPNRMRGAYGGVVFEAREDLRYRQVTSLTPGIVDQF